ncbi:MAG: glycosyltransferase family 2 protein [Sedimentisphaerales bacterium]|nr:glycosyltransferase family 2 protein [Sedimentisphaerales bacterium]
MDVSIIIVSWNTKGLLRDCLSSVCENAGEIDYEIIVIDNASTDGSAEMVKNDFKQVILIENSENRGFAAANNQGMAIAKGRYVLLLNSDTVVLDDAIANTARFADENPQAAVIGCRVLNPDRTLQRTCFMFPSVLNMLLSSTYLYKLFPKSRFFGREQMTWWNRNDVRPVDVVTGCYMLVRREAIDQVGMMDERFFMYCEETDWCYRFREKGWMVMFAPVGQIIHFGGQSTAQKPVAMIVQLRLSILKFMKKHYSLPVYLFARLLVAMFFAVRLPVWLAKSLIQPAGSNEAAIKMKAYSTGVVSALLGKVYSERV